MKLFVMVFSLAFEMKKSFPGICLAFHPFGGVKVGLFLVTSI
jgi:hypothetical protein